MTTALAKVEALLPTLSAGEKVQLLQWVVSEIGGVFLGVEKTIGVCGGAARISRTRIPVWLLVRQRQLNITEEDILHDYPSLRAEDLSNAWNYYRGHKSEIDLEIKENENA